MLAGLVNKTLDLPDSYLTHRNMGVEAHRWTYTCTPVHKYASPYPHHVAMHMHIYPYIKF